MSARSSSLKELVGNGEVSGRLDNRLHNFFCTPLDTMSQGNCMPLDTNNFLGQMSAIADICKRHRSLTIRIVAVR